MIASRAALRRSLGLATAVLLAGVPVLSACGGSSTGGGSSSAPPSASASSAPLWAEPGEGALDDQTAAELQKAVDDWVAAGHLVGATVAVVTPSGTWSGASGADGAGTALQPTSALWMASITKTFVAAEVMLLSSRGLVDLDAPLTDYVDVPFETGGATVREALAMRTGFPDYPVEQYQQTIAADLNRDWTAPEMLATLPEDAPAGGTRGGAPYYNSINYVLLGELIAEVTGTPFAQAIRSDLLEPAGVGRIWVQTGEAPTAPSSVGTQVPGVTLVDPAGPYLPSRSAASFTAGGGCMAGDAADVARWGYLLYGGHVIDSALVQEMQADPQPEPNLGPYGLGTMVMTDGTGATMLGHAGGGIDWPYSAVLTVWTGSEPVSVALLTPQPAEFGTDIYDLVIQLHGIAAS